MSVIWASLEKRENEVLYLCCCSYVYFRFPVYHSADCCTSLSLFLYLSGPFLVHHRLRFSTSFQYLMEAVSVLLFPDSSTCTSRFLYNLCFFLVLVSGTFLNSVVTSMYVFYTNLSGVFRYCHCQLPLSAYLSVNSFILIYLSVCFSMYFSSMRLFRYLQVLRSLIPSVSAFSLICL